MLVLKKSKFKGLHWDKKKSFKQCLLTLFCHPELVSGSYEMLKQVQHDRTIYELELTRKKPDSVVWVSYN